MPQDELRDFCRNTKLVQIRRESAPECVPAVPPSLEYRLDDSTTQIVQVKGSSHLLTRENPSRFAVALAMCVQSSAQWCYHWHSGTRLRSFCVTDVRAPNGAPDVNELTVIIRPLKPTKFAFSQA